ncbi:MAG: hypothetical protein RL223_3727 [Pseudomonadota bacterium]
MSFAELGLQPALARAASAEGWATPTPAQQAAIPALLAGRDLLLQSRTGSGKTAAYALPLLQQWLEGTPRAPRPTRGLVLVPTRELALQVAELLRGLAHALPGLAKVALAFGGVSINPQLMGLRGGADIMVATPGRLLDIVRHNGLRLDDVATLVLDEADRLLDLGFADELQQVLALLPARRQTALCSATFPDSVQRLAEGLLRDPVEVRLSAAQTRPDIRQRAICVDTARRTALLRQLLAEHATQAGEHGDHRALVFVASQHGAEHVADKLRRHGLSAEAFHGGRSQGARTDLLDAFKDGDIRVLLATDMAARGLHIDALPLVVNYDLPRAAEDYVHRIGRTGRAGGHGDAISFITPETEGHFRLIEKRQGLRVTRETVAGFEPVAAAPQASATPVALGDADPSAEAADAALEPTAEAATAHAEPAPTGHGTGLDPMGGVKGKRPSKKDKARAEAAAASAAADGAGGRSATGGARRAPEAPARPRAPASGGRAPGAPGLPPVRRPRGR